MSKKKLLKILNAKEEQKAKLGQRAQVTEDITELRSINTELTSLNGEIEELRGIVESMPEDNNSNEEGEFRSEKGETQNPNGAFNPVATYKGASKQEERSVEDIYNSVEYRKAFMDYVTKGTPIPDQYKPTEEMRADSLTVTSDIAAVIPTNILNKVIEEATVQGKILKRVSQTSYIGGIDIPVSDLKPTAYWIAEDKPSETQKGELKSKISFSYHMLECKVALSLLSTIVSLPIFEQTVIGAIKKAMIVTLEDAIVNGDGSGKPKGFLKYSLQGDQVINFKEDDISTVKKWSEPEANLPEAYEEKGIYLMNKKTWEKYLNGMVDTTGQKIGLGKINEKGQRILNGREVLVCDKFKSFDVAAEGEIFGALIDLEEYLLNSNMAMSYKRYWVEDDNKYIHKALMIADGKMLDTKGMIYLKKATK